MRLAELFFAKQQGRSHLFSGRRRRIPPRRRRIVFEPLEDRLLLSVSLLGVPDWIEQGPGPSINGQTAGLAGPNPVVGAIEAIAPHPTDANTISVGTVAGGIWRTTNGGVTWTPQTDQWPSLSISAIAYSPLDATNNTLFAGTGSFSSGGNGGPAVGALRTTDGGNTWVPTGSEFSGERVRSIVPTSIGTSLADQVVLVATIDAGGVYRSTDGGDTFSLISGSSGAADGLDNDADGTTDEAGEVNLPAGNASHLVADPGNANRFYAALPGRGVFRSDNGGANWVQVNTGLTGVGAASRIELSVSAAAGNPVYAGLISGGSLANVFRSANQGGNWTQLGAAPAIHPGNQAGTHFSILADNAASNIVYVGGDRQAGSPFVGNLFRGDSNTNTWSSIVLAGAGGTAPHADSRDMVFDASGNVLESDDGGIYRLINPNAAGTTWQSLPNMPRVAQFITNIDYDELNNTSLGGTQDTGSPEQIAGFTWRDLSQADGGFVAVDNDQVAHPGTTLHYSSFQQFGNFTRRTLDATNTPTASAGVGLVVTGAGGKTLLSSATMGTNTYNFDSTIQFTQPFVLNSVNPARMLIGTSFLYESTDNGDTLTSLGGVSNLNSNGVDDDLDGAIDDGDEFVVNPAGNIGAVRAMVYGGRSGGADNADLIYVASGATLRLRTANATNSLADFTTLTAYPGGAIRDIEIDPDDWQRGYVVDSAGRVFRFANNGAAAANWTEITGDLGDLVTDVRDVELFTPTSAAGDDFVLVSGFGGVYRTLDPGSNSVWTEFGGNLPNAICTDLLYDPVDDVLVAGTYGRGAWTIASASTKIPVPGVLQIDGDTDFADEDDAIKLMLDPNNPLLLDVFLNSVTPTLTVQLSTLQQIDVNGLGGEDELILDLEFGDLLPPLGLTYDGGTETQTPGDFLRLIGDGTTTVAYSPSGTTPGSGTVTIGGRTITFTDLEPVIMSGMASITLTTPNSADVLAVDSPGAGQNRVSGSSDGVALESLTFFDTTSVTLNLALNDGASPADTVSIDASGLVASGLQNLTINTGSGADTLTITAASFALPVPGGAFTFNAGTGTDHVIASADVSYALTDTSLGIAGDGDIVLVGFAGDQATLTGGGSPNSFTVSNWTGQATLDGAGSGDTYAVTFLGAGSGTTTINDTGGSGTDQAVVSGTAGADALVVTATHVTRASEVVNYAGLEALTVDAEGGVDTVTVDSTGAATATTVLGGSGEDDFTVNATGAAGLILDGEGDSDDYTVNFGGLVGPVTVADSGPPPPDVDTLLVNGTAGADTLVLTPTQVTRGAEVVNYAGIEELTVDAGGGSDTLSIEGTAVPTAVLGGAGDDAFTVNATGAGGPLYLDGQEDSDTYTVNLGASLAAPVTINDTGTAGTDTLAVNGTPGDDTIILTDSGVTGGGGAGLSFSGIENFSVDAGAGDDLVDGSALTIPVTIFGGTGNDTLIAGSGNDSLFGEEGDDDLIGGLGADFLDGGAGSDGLLGDKGTIVRVLLDGSTAAVLSTPDKHLQAEVDQAGTIKREVTLLDAEQGGDDTMLGGSGADFLHGGAGNDQMDGGDGDDALFGDLGDDSMMGGAGSDHLFGGMGNDSLDGGTGADIAYGGEGDDRLVADSRDDRLIDWLGNFNDFVVPGPSYGGPTIVRSPSPWVRDFLLDLAAADGALDPNGEIALVIPGSPEQQSNSGKGGRAT